MNTRGLLDQLLKSGQEMLQNKTGGKPGASGGGQLGSLLSGAGGGALGGGQVFEHRGRRRAPSRGSIEGGERAGGV